MLSQQSESMAPTDSTLADYQTEARFEAGLGLGSYPVPSSAHRPQTGSENHGDPGPNHRAAAAAPTCRCPPADLRRDWRPRDGLPTPVRPQTLLRLGVTAVQACQGTSPSPPVAPFPTEGRGSTPGGAPAHLRSTRLAAPSHTGLAGGLPPSPRLRRTSARRESLQEMEGRRAACTRRIAWPI